MREIKIGNRLVGAASPALVIAEVGYNFNGDYTLAHQMIDEAAAAGADIIKFQTYTASGHVSARESRSQWEALRQTELPRERHAELQRHVEEKGCVFLSTPSDEEDADFLEGLGVPAFKLGSDDCSNYQYVRYLARKGRPLIISTGTCTLAEVGGAVEAARAEGNQELILLQCTSSYPAEARFANLRAMQTMGQAFQVPVGFSDHTVGLAALTAAVALGAKVIEKHFTFDKQAPGPDHALSVDYADFRDLVRAVREAEAALGSPSKEPAACESSMLETFRKSVVARRDIPAGTHLTRELLTVKRPATGIPAKHFELALGRIARVDIPADSVIKWEMV